MWKHLSVYFWTPPFVEFLRKRFSIKNCLFVTRKKRYYLLVKWTKISSTEKKVNSVRSVYVKVPLSERCLLKKCVNIVLCLFYAKMKFMSEWGGFFSRGDSLLLKLRISCCLPQNEIALPLGFGFWMVNGIFLGLRKANSYRRFQNFMSRKLV